MAAKLITLFFKTFIMKIVKRGIDPKEIEKTCLNCNSVLSFTKGELTVDRNGSYVKCPVCGNTVYAVYYNSWYDR